MGSKGPLLAQAWRRASLRRRSYAAAAVLLLAIVGVLFAAAPKERGASTTRSTETLRPRQLALMRKQRAAQAELRALHARLAADAARKQAAAQPELRALRARLAAEAARAEAARKQAAAHR